MNVKVDKLYPWLLLLLLLQVLGRLQVARGMVASYPVYPDLLAISNVLQEQQAEEGEGELEG